MGDSYGFKSSNNHTAAPSQVGNKRKDMKSGNSSLNGYAGRGIGISKSLNRGFKPLRD